MSNKITIQFVEAAKRFRSFVRNLKFWNPETRTEYYRLRNDYMEKRKLNAKDAGLDKIMPERMWPR